MINVAEKSLRIDCDCARLGAVRLALERQDATSPDPCLQDDRCRFDCESQVGTTRFVIPGGRYAISVIPLDDSGQALGPDDGVTYPPPTVRDVLRGELTSLGVSLFLVAQSRLAGRTKCDEEWLEPP